MESGSFFDGKYLILDILGKGGMSTVYLAQNIKLGTLWAIKEIGKKSNPRIDLFIEPNILKKLNHPALPRIFDIIEEDEYIYIVVDYIEGINLDKELKRAKVIEERILIGWAKELCEVLDYLHNIKPNPIIYRDMKPSNIILTKDGALKLIDFGIAREYKFDCGNDTVYIGTRGYAAPEQYGNSQTNATTDIYSLGITLLELLSGIGPKEKEFENLVQDYSRKNNPNSLERIVLKCIQLNTHDRYQSIKELASDIEIYERSKNNQAPEFYSSKSQTFSNEAHIGRIISFKKLVLSIWGNSEFACEFAYLAAKLTDFKVLLINLDFLNGEISDNLNLKKDLQSSIFEYGFSEALNDCEIGKLSKEMLMAACSKRQDMSNLYVLKSNYDVNNYGTFREKNIEKLISLAYKCFELTIVSVNKSVFDIFSINSFLHSDYIIAPTRCDKATIKEYMNHARHLSDVYDISPQKVGYVAFEYKDGINLPIERFKSEVGFDSYLGTISYSSKREIYRNLNSVYSKRMDEECINGYKEIMTKFNIIQKPNLKEKMEGWLLKIKRNTVRKKGKVAFR